MLADLDLLLLVVYCMADDFLPTPPGNRRRRVTDAEIVTLCVAQAIMGIPSDYRFVAVAGKRLRHLFPTIPSRDAFHKRRIRLSGQIEALIAHFARQSPGSSTICCWSTPPRSSALAPAKRSSAAAPRASPTRSPTPPTTATAPATAATSSGFACTPCSPPTAPQERSL